MEYIEKRTLGHKEGKGKKERKCVVREKANEKEKYLTQESGNFRTADTERQKEEGREGEREKGKNQEDREGGG